jgi:hypothetical protein
MGEASTDIDLKSVKVSGKGFFKSKEPWFGREIP